MASVGQRRRIELVQAVSSKGANGAWNNSRTKYTFWAEVLNSGGGRDYNNNKTVLSSNYKFRVRYNASVDIKANWSVVYNGKQFTVTNISRENEKTFYLIIEARG